VPLSIEPEILISKEYTGLRMNVWSAEVALYAILYGSVTFKENYIEEMLLYIIVGNYKFRNKASESAKDFLRKILNVNEETRYTIEDNLHHDWMQNIKPKENIFNTEEIDSDFNILQGKILTFYLK
jgi:serine/threonine protein kinase